MDGAGTLALRRVQHEIAIIAQTANTAARATMPNIGI